MSICSCSDLNEVRPEGRTKAISPSRRALSQGRLNERLGDGRKAHGPVKPAPAEQRDLVAALPRDDAVAVIFDFVQPTVAVRHLVDQRGKLGRDEFRLYRAAGLRRLFAVPAEGFAVARFAVGLFF